MALTTLAPPAGRDPGDHGPGAVPIVDTSTAGKPLGWWGMIGLIASEGTLFGLLLFVALFIRANNHPWPPAGIADPELVRSGIRTAILLGSSIPAFFAERALRHRRLRRFQALLVVTMAMGAIFLIGHALEYLKLSEELTPTSNAYGSVFYLVTGLHAVHLTVGLIVLGYMLVQGMRGRYDSGGEPVGVQCGFLYWHFVDAVWIAVFSVLYLSERI